MNTRDNYLNFVNRAYEIANDCIVSESALQNLTEAKDDLVKRLESDAFIKIPFVGDFSAGKSTLLNTLLNRESLLPTDITPVTAVSYELWYSGTESVEHYRKGKLVDSYDICKIGEIPVEPGDIVKVFVDNVKIKELNNRGIVLVDMPGIDSGIEAHTAAIMNYIHQGTFFVVVTNIEQGTLKGTTLSFIQELKKYGISAAVLLSKCDKKTEEQIKDIKDNVQSLVHRVLTQDTFVGVTSSSTGNIEDLETCLNNIDAEAMIQAKYDGRVKAFVTSVIDHIYIRIELLQAPSTDYEKELKELSAKKEKAIEDLLKNSKNSQSVEDSASDILYDIDYTLKQNTNKLAALLFGNKDNSVNLQGEIMSIIRPVLINSFNREINEYQDVLDDGVRNFSVDVSDIFLDIDDENERFEEAKNLLNGVLPELLTAFNVDPLLASLISKIVAKYVPDALRALFGKSDVQVLSEIKKKLEGELYPQVTTNLRPSIESILSQERNEIFNKAQEEIQTLSESYDETLRQVERDKITDEQAREGIIAALSKQVDELKTQLMS